MNASMTTEIGQPIKERAVDSLQQIYAVIIALAIAQAIESLLKDPLHGDLLAASQIFAGFPACVAFVVTVVPFWHGMNRHLDRCYVEKKTAVVHRALLLDFGTFFLEAILLFAVGLSLRSGIWSFFFLGLLLSVDMVWGALSHRIHFRGHKSHVLKWSAINLVAIVIAVLVVVFPIPHKITALMFVAILRTIVDYSLCSSFYFPPSG